MIGLMKALAQYGISGSRGFLPVPDPLDRLPEAYAAWEDIAANGSALLMAGRLRRVVDGLPVLDPGPLGDGPERERAMLLLTVLANAYVHGEQPGTDRLPPPLARPLHEVAGRLDRPPIVAHASIVLNNWRRIDPAAPLGVTNIDTQVTFLGGIDEKWFYLATVGVELAGAAGLEPLVSARRAAATGDGDALITELGAVTAAITAAAEALTAIEKWCDHYVFYHRVRPFLAGWPEPGIRFEGVDDRPRILAGGSAAQSSLIQAFDAGLDIAHEAPLTSGFLTSMRRFMPVGHRRFLDDLRAGPSVREFAGRDPRLSGAYDEAVRALAALRHQHIGIAARYVRRFERDGGHGTGGSDFVPFLRTSKEETAARILG